MDTEENRNSNTRGCPLYLKLAVWCFTVFIFCFQTEASEKKLSDGQYQDICVYFERWFGLNGRKTLAFTSDVNEPSRQYSKKMESMLAEDESLYKQFFTRFFKDDKYKEHLRTQQFFFNRVIPIPKNRQLFFELCRFFAEENGKLMDFGISYFEGETYHKGLAREYFDWVLERQEKFKNGMRDFEKRELELNIYDEKRKQKRYKELSDEIKEINAKDINWFLACLPDELLVSNGKIKPNLKDFKQPSRKIKAVLSKQFYPKEPDYYNNYLARIAKAKKNNEPYEDIQWRVNMEFKWFMKYPLELLNRYPRKEISSETLEPITESFLNTPLKYSDRKEIGWRPPMEGVFRGIILLGKSKDGSIPYIITINPGSHTSSPSIIFYRLTYGTKGQLLTVERLINTGEKCGKLMKDFCTKNGLGYVIAYNFYFPFPFFYQRSSNPQTKALDSSNQIMNEIKEIIELRAKQDKEDKKIRNKMEAISDKEIAKLKEIVPNYIKAVDTRYLEDLPLKDLLMALQEIKAHRSKLKMSKELEEELGDGEHNNLEIYRYMDHSDYKDTVDEQVKYIQEVIEPKKEKQQLKMLYKLIPDFKTLVEGHFAEDSNKRVLIRNVKDREILIRAMKGIKEHRKIWEGKESEDFVRMIYDYMKDRASRLKRIRSVPQR